MANKSMKSPRVFLCHARKDYDVVYTLYKRLLKDGIDVYLDEENVLPGQDRDLEIRNAIRNADIVIICLTKEFVQAGYHQREMRIALEEADMQPEGRIYIIPVRLEDCDAIKGLSRWQTVDLFRTGGYEKVKHSMHAHIAELKEQVHVDPVNTNLLIYENTTPIISNEVVNGNRQDKNKNSKPKESKKSLKTKRINVRGEKKSLRTEIVVAFIGAFAYIIAGFLGSPITEKIFIFNAKPSFTVTPTIDQKTYLPLLYPAEITDVDLAGNIIFMSLVPPGKFIMGSDFGINDGNLVYPISINAFYIDVKEVTNVLYEACVNAGACQPPKSLRSYSRDNYYGNIYYKDYPVINVSWHMAKNYCEWRGASLPTEVQWEKAARGGLEGKPYPWGDNLPVCEKNMENGAKFNDKSKCFASDTEVVGSYLPNGYGLYDMSGNVWEWTGSLYRPYPYNSVDGREDLTSSGARVLRGGSWFNVEYLQRVSFRNKGDPDLVSYYIGFRCARLLP